jgi:hypothetical protein
MCPQDSEWIAELRDLTEEDRFEMVLNELLECLVLADMLQVNPIYNVAIDHAVKAIEDQGQRRPFAYVGVFPLWWIHNLYERLPPSSPAFSTPLISGTMKGSWSD